MLINKFTGCESKDEKSFRRKLKVQMLTFCVFIVAGAGIITAYFVSPGGGQDFQAGFTVGLGSAFAAIGIVRFIKAYTTLKKPERLHEAYTELMDERNRFIIMKTYQTASTVFMCLLAVATVVAVFMGQKAVSCTLAVCMSVFALAIRVAQQMARRKY